MKYFRRFLLIALFGVLVFGTIFSAQAQDRTVVIGFTASQSGRYNVESTRQINGLNLWLNQVNEAGGIILSDGTVITFNTVFYDDESNTDRVQELYTRLATDDNADFLISPYSSGLTDASAIIAEQYGKIMITTGAASDSTYQKGYSLVFQTYTPASRYLTGALDLLASLDDTVENIAIVHENDKFSTDVSTALNDYAIAMGFNVVLFEGYDSGTTDFAPFINKIQDAAPDAVLGGGHFQDGSTFARQMHEKDLDVKFVALLVAPPEPNFAELGESAIGVIGPSQWEPLAQIDEAAAEAAGMEFYGPSGEEFVTAYMEAYEEEPSYHAAGGYVAGLLLQRAIEDADSLDTQAVKEALDALDLLTFFGHIQFDITPEQHGLQIGHSMMYIQWQGMADALEKDIVWPPEAVTADALYPLNGGE
ncbi:MAG: amino acid ABC transporter substrate-binding protein [Anaerolineaceae bacterium]|nr:amino acid ABC transporter substrate-binding protein [Anaerolineaceae bacterium]